MNKISNVIFRHGDRLRTAAAGMAALEAGAGEQDLFPHLPPPCGGHPAGTFGRHYSFGRSVHADGRLPAALPALRTGYPDRPGVAGCGAFEKRESIALPFLVFRGRCGRSRK